jgi:hypothetical protein
MFRVTMYPKGKVKCEEKLETLDRERTLRIRAQHTLSTPSVCNSGRWQLSNIIVLLIPTWTGGLGNHTVGVLFVVHTLWPWFQHEPLPLNCMLMHTTMLCTQNKSGGGLLFSKSASKPLL